MCTKQPPLILFIILLLTLSPVSTNAQPQFNGRSHKFLQCTLFLGGLGLIGFGLFEGKHWSDQRRERAIVEQIRNDQVGPFEAPLSIIMNSGDLESFQLLERTFLDTPAVVISDQQWSLIFSHLERSALRYRAVWQPRSHRAPDLTRISQLLGVFETILQQIPVSMERKEVILKTLVGLLIIDSPPTRGEIRYFPTIITQEIERLLLLNSKDFSDTLTNHLSTVLHSRLEIVEKALSADIDIADHSELLKTARH